MSLESSSSVPPREKDEPVRVRLYSRRRFSSSDFEPSNDKFKDAVVIPQRLADRLFPDGAKTGYVSVSSPGGDRSWTLYALTFSDEYESVTDDPLPDGYLRRNVREELEAVGINPSSEGVVVELEGVAGGDSGPLCVERFSTHAESTRVGECRTHPSTVEAIGVADGSEVELYNPITGGRMRATIRAVTGLEPDEVSLSTRARKLLQVEFEERADDGTCTVVHVRKPVDVDTPTGTDGLLGPVREYAGKVTGRIADVAVGHHEIRLRVNIGLNADEGRRAARVNPETMGVLGIDDGDRITVSSPTGERTVRCHSIAPDSHLIETDEDFEPEDIHERVILLPATEREAVNVVCDDVVAVRRDPSYVAVKSIVPSLFGFVGVFIGGVQTVDFIVPPEYYLPALGSTVVFGLVAVWLVLWPERQRCR